MQAAYLQARFAEVCGPEWQCRAEVPLLPPALAAQLGYAPRADVLLERRDRTLRRWTPTRARNGVAGRAAARGG